MAAANPIQASFVVGELSGLMAGRTDLQNYFAGLKTMQNYFPTPQGPAVYRPGTYYVAEVKNSAHTTRLIEFHYSTIQAYILELGDQYIRFYKDNARITYEVITLDAAPAPGDFAPGATLTGSSSGTTSKVVSKTSSTVYVIQSRDGAYTDGEDITDGTNTATGAAGYPEIANGDPYEVTTPWLHTQVNSIQFAQSANKMYLCCVIDADNEHPVQLLERVSHNEWTLTEKATGGTPFTAGVGEEDFDAAEHYPACVTFHEERLCFGCTLTDPQTVWGSVVGDWNDFTLGSSDSDAFEYTPASDRIDAIRWMLSANDLVFGTIGGEWKGADLSPDSLPTLRRQSAYGSTFLQAILLSDTIFYFQRTARKVQEIRYDYDSDSYVSREMTIMADHITGDDGIGGRAHQNEPNNVLWCWRIDGTMAVMCYDRQQNVYGWARVVTDGLFESVASIGQTREDEVWVIVKRTIDGSDVRYVEYFKPRNWGADQADIFYVDSGLTFDGGAAKTITNITAADPIVVTSVAHGIANDSFVRIRNVSGMTEVNDRVYQVKNAAADTFELWQQDGADGIDGSGYTAYVSGGTATVVAKTVSGLDHLEGESVVASVDGAAHAAVTVASGSITLNNYFNTINAGLSYTGILETMDLEAGGQKGTAQGKLKSMSKIVVRLHESLGGEVGPDADNLEPLLQRTGADNMGEPPPLATGDYDANWRGGSEDQLRVYLKHDKPLPMTIVAFMPEMVTHD